MRILFYVGCLTLFISFSPVLGESSPQDAEVLIAFSAKGTDVGIDGGFMRALYEHYRAVHEGRVVVSGSSSGSIMAALFGCYGVNEKGFEAMDAALKVFDKSKIDVDPGLIYKKLIEGRGDRVYQPQSNLDGIISVITNHRTCVPQHPVVIEATNLDVLDGRETIPVIDYTVPLLVGSVFKGADLSDYTVFSYSDPLHLYRKAYLGRACTYFVNESMFETLSTIPSDERLCDLRPIRTPFDMELAIRASVSEPTYFPSISEPHPEMLVPATYEGKYPPAIWQRTYNGGYAMTIVTQDIKRALPEIYAFGTGRTHFDGGVGFWHHVQNAVQLKQSRFIKVWYGNIDVNEAIDRGRWWLDAEIPYSDAEWAKIGDSSSTVAENIRFGYQKAMKCIDGSVDCTPAAGRAPKYSFDSSGLVPMSSRVKRPLSLLERVE